MTEFLEFVTAWIFLGVAGLCLIARRRPVPEWLQQRQHSKCCLEQACSSMCATRQTALVTTGAVDGAKHAGRVHQLVAGPELPVGPEGGAGT